MAKARRISAAAVGRDPVAFQTFIWLRVFSTPEHCPLPAVIHTNRWAAETFNEKRR